ncbi:MAG: hypothetical protein JZU65_07570, partial [Chlorobium sp.]|nr:hypothetical protein [Chlorobium sp.]
IFLVPMEHNAKGIGLLLSGYCNIYKAQQESEHKELGRQDDFFDKITYLADLLISMQSIGYSGACWGYNFDWQARRLFLFPKNTPTVVATAFCATALFEAFEITRNENLLETALSSARFVLNDLHRTPKSRGFLFSYSPLAGNNTVYNASLMASKLLSYCYHYCKDEAVAAAARESVQACVDAQQSDGSWRYGELPVQSWVDSFHTGYNLEALQAYQEQTGDDTFAPATEKGFAFYVQNFFLHDGKPKYYHNNTWPIDIHCPAQFFVTLSRLHKFEEHKELAAKVMDWSIRNMQDPKGYFYYQLKKTINSKISYMRWSNAFMLYARKLTPNNTPDHWCRYFFIFSRSQYK